MTEIVFSTPRKAANKLKFNVCVACGVQSGIARKLNNTPSKRKGLCKLLLRFGGISISEGYVCRQCEHKITKWEADIDLFRQTCQQRFVLGGNSKRGASSPLDEGLSGAGVASRNDESVARKKLFKQCGDIDDDLAHRLCSLFARSDNASESRSFVMPPHEQGAERLSVDVTAGGELSLAQIKQLIKTVASGNVKAIASATVSNTLTTTS